MSRLMRAEGGEVAASIFPRVGSAEQSIDSSPARLFILIAADGRHAAAVLPILSTSLHHFVAKSKKKEKEMVHFLKSNSQELH